MTERMTYISLPSANVSGMSDHGKKTPAEMIALLRRYAEVDLKRAQAILNAKDEDFRVTTGYGIYVRTKESVLQEGRQWKK